MRGAGGVVTLQLVAVLAACVASDDGSVERARADPAADAAVASASPRPAGAPEVEEQFQARVDEAWREATDGENPSSTCAAVKGRAAVAEPGSADRALVACNVDIPARYFLTFADRVEAGEKTCMDLLTEVRTRLPAMTISTKGFGDLARQQNADTSTAAAVGAGAAILAGEAAGGGGANDARQRVRDRLRDRVTAVCPGEAGIILG